MPAEASAQLLGLGSKQNCILATFQAGLTKILPDLCRVFLEYTEIKQAKKGLCWQEACL